VWCMCCACVVPSFGAPGSVCLKLWMLVLWAFSDSLYLPEGPKGGKLLGVAAGWGCHCLDLSCITTPTRCGPHHTSHLGGPRKCLPVYACAVRGVAEWHSVSVGRPPREGGAGGLQQVKVVDGV
jgi:hypothetical protein